MAVVFAGSVLIDNKSIDTVGEVEATQVGADGASKTVAVWATTWDGATVTLRATPDGGTTWIDLTDNGTVVTFTANEVRVINRLGIGLTLGAKITTAGGSTAGIYARIF